MAGKSKGRKEGADIFININACRLAETDGDQTVLFIEEVLETRGNM